MLCGVSIGLLREFVDRHRRLFVLTGAGCSTDSGIPDYRDADGSWKRKPPVLFRDFMEDPAARKRYWVRSFIGWKHFGRAEPNEAHRAIARLEQDGRIELLVTQNVDGLHQAGGSVNVVELHGRVDQIRCMQCEARTPRREFQTRLLSRNPAWDTLDGTVAPDGDADFEHADVSRFEIPACEACGGILKPDVVFFGESVPAERVRRAMRALGDADAMLIVGSSLMVYSGYRFAHAAAQAGKPIASINVGRTRADESLTLKINERCARVLWETVSQPCWRSLASTGGRRRSVGLRSGG
jgi:NAD-dependent SIR2 family protein deacetylase